MRNGRDGGKKTGGKKRMMKKVATTSLPAIDRWNAARSCQVPDEDTIEKLYLTTCWSLAFWNCWIPLFVLFIIHCPRGDLILILSDLHHSLSKILPVDPSRISVWFKIKLASGLYRYLNRRIYRKTNNHLREAKEKLGKFPNGGLIRKQNKTWSLVSNSSYILGRHAFYTWVVSNCVCCWLVYMCCRLYVLQIARVAKCTFAKCKKSLKN